ncbi:MAG TPA: hypothetical protein ENN80_04660, partial [Candidatus Hydrogenedentes bacterium]|nr:hypothetical protein [Candidatus Hydrogenedentota bacterium]
MTTALLILVLGAFEHTDAFNYPDGTEGEPAWFAESIVWSVRDGAMHIKGGPRSFARLDQAPHAARMTCEATVTVRERRNGAWGVAGLALRRDTRNYWHIALIESPESEGRRHFVELCESLDGTWLAQSNEGTRLTNLAHEGGTFDWQFGRPYRLRIELTPERIEGYVFEMDGARRAHLAFAFDNRAATTGQPALEGAELVATFDDFQTTIEEEAPAPVVAPPARPPYDVPACDTIVTDATGFFYAKELDGRWWLIDPKGRAFYIVGTDHIRYAGHWCQALGYAPYGRTTRAKYDSEEPWAQATAERLAAWGFNTLPAGHSESMRYRNFAHIEFLSFGSWFAGIDDLCPKTTWTGFPNVFSPDWPRHCDKVARRACAIVKDDPWLIGYFLDNELEWYGKTWHDWGLFHEAWKKPAGHSGKQAWIDFLAENLDGPAAFAEQWGVEVAGLDDLAAHSEPNPPQNEAAKDLARRWVRRVAEAYFKTAAEAVRRHDPNHLILGSRFAGSAPDIWDICGKHCDVVSFNMYPRIDIDRGLPARVIDQIRAWHADARKPMMITEWSFPALDSGLPCEHGAGMRVETQAQRARCFTHFQKAMFALPFMVGSDFFMFVDEPALGISDTFPEDTNYGLVNEQDEPYPELTQAAAALNPRVYELHRAGQVEPAAAPTLARWLREMPDAEQPIPTGPLRYASGALSLEGPIGGVAWRLKRGDTPLGELYTLIHQSGAQDLWVRADSSRVKAIHANDKVTAVDVEFALKRQGEAITEVDIETGSYAEQVRGPQRFRCGWRFWIPAAPLGWIASECLWVENTETAAWRLAEIFHYLVPELGGSNENDEPFSAGVPNYYLRGAAWCDAEADLGV